jgi:CBS domain containing-hemolysin-like protein
MASALMAFSVVAFLILVNALYVAAEFGAVSVRRSRIQELANGGHRLAARLLPVIRDAAALDRYVATCQIGITLSSLVLGAYGQATLAVSLARVLETAAGLDAVPASSTASLVVLVALTATQVVVGELIPKSLALQNPTSAALFTLVPMLWSTWLFHGFIAILNGSGSFLLRMTGVAGAEGHRHVHSPDELELLIAESRDGGLLEPDEQHRLHEALRLGVRTARQLMVPRTAIAAIDASWDPYRVLHETLASPFSRLPVYEGALDNLIGTLHARDLVMAYVHERPADLRRLLRPAVTVPETMAAHRLLRFLREHRTHQALVIDEFGGIAGLVTLEDVLSELLGHVGDEFQHAAGGGPERMPDGRLRVPGSTPIDQAQRWLAVEWDSEADTVGGYVLQLLGRMAREGDSVRIGGTLIEVEGLKGRVPGSLLITPGRTGAERPHG